MIAYIDESGDTGLSKKSSKSFILTAIIVSDTISLERIARKVFRTKIKNKSKSNQLHANKDTEKVHKAIIKELDKIEYKVLVQNDKNYFKNIESLFLSLSKQGVEKIILAQRDRRKTTFAKINKISLDLSMDIDQTIPINSKGLQIADFVSWSVFRSLEYKDFSYLEKLKNIEYLKK